MAVGLLTGLAALLVGKPVLVSSGPDRSECLCGVAGRALRSTPMVLFAADFLPDRVGQVALQSGWDGVFGPWGALAGSLLWPGHPPRRRLETARQARLTGRQLSVVPGLLDHMDIAKCLTVIDALCAREFPVAHGRTEHGESGPGYHIAALQTSGDFWEDDGTEWEETAEQYEADRDGLTERLTGRWGPPQRFSLRSVLVRTTEGEGIEEPWARLSEHVPDVHLWKAPAPDRWFALGVSHGYKQLPFRLLGIVTGIDPP